MNTLSTAVFMLLVTQKRLPNREPFITLAEGEGFEPSLPMLWAKRFSRPPHSAALPPFQKPVFRNKAIDKADKRKRSFERFFNEIHSVMIESCPHVNSV